MPILPTNECHELSTVNDRITELLNKPRKCQFSSSEIQNYLRIWIYEDYKTQQVLAFYNQM